MNTQAPTVHHLRRETVHIGGFTTESGYLAASSVVGLNNSSYVDRVKPDMHADVRLMVEGTKSVGFGLVATDADLHRNLGPGLPTAPGVYLGAYGLAACIDNHGGSGREIAEAKAAGLLVEAKLGDLLELDGNLWEIQLADNGRDRHNLTLRPVDPSPECAVFSVAPPAFGR